MENLLPAPASCLGSLPSAMQDQPHPAVPTLGKQAILYQEEKHREKKAGIT